MRGPHHPVIDDSPERPPIQPLYALVADDCDFAIDLFVTRRAAEAALSHVLRLVHRGGLNAEILRGGELRPGDDVVPS